MSLLRNKYKVQTVRTDENYFGLFNIVFLWYIAMIPAGIMTLGSSETSVLMYQSIENTMLCNGVQIPENYILYGDA